MRLAALGLALSLLGAACADEEPAPGGAEFLVSAGDSTYWVRPAGGDLRLRGSAILLARFDGRFHEVYVTDVDRSYEDAVFVGQRVWRRDLLRGDSLVVFEDTLVPRLARAWAADRPEARLLEPNEPEAEEPLASATAEVAVIAVHGPYLSYEYHADVERADEAPWHTTRRGVVDLRSGRPVAVADLFGPAAAAEAIADARRRFGGTVDSLRRAGGEAAELAAALGAFAFDPASFSLGGDADAPVVEFHVPGSGEGASGDLAIPLTAVAMPVPAWWSDVRPTLPEDADAVSAARWTHRDYLLTAEYAGERAHLSLRQGDARPRRLGSVQAPVHHILWLDPTPADSAARRGLARAFDEAVFYDDLTRTAGHEGRGRRPRCTAAHRWAPKPRA